MTECAVIGQEIASVYALKTLCNPLTAILVVAGTTRISPLQEPINIDQFQMYAAAGGTATSSGRSGRAIILVVERDPSIRDLEAYFLNEAGFAVEFAADGAAALEQAKKIRPDIIISEVLVPKMDGLSLCRRVKSDPNLRGTVVLIFSILAVQARAKEAGADAFLMKPLAEQRLVDTVRQLLDTRRTIAST